MRVSREDISTSATEVLQFGQYFTDHELMVVDMSLCGIHQQVQLQQNLSLKFMVPYFRLMKMVRDWCREICLCRTFFKSLNKYF